MTELVKLVPRLSAVANQETVEILENALAEAREGKIAAVILLMRFADGDHGHEASTTTEFLEDVGQLEVVKQRLIARYWAAQKL